MHNIVALPDTIVRIVSVWELGRGLLGPARTVDLIYLYHLPVVAFFQVIAGNAARSFRKNQTLMATPTFRTRHYDQG